jgi:hypoxanthine phosphoribosyltransferase
MKKIYYSWSQIEGAVLDIARQIQKDHWRPDYIVGITRGGAIPAVLLSQYLNVPMHPLEVSLRDGGQCVSDCEMAEDALGYPKQEPIVTDENDIASVLDAASSLLEEGSNFKNILVVDDINDSGSTIEWIKKDWQSSCLPYDTDWPNVWNNNVRFAVLTNNMASKETVNYYCWEVNKAEEDCWLVYPWEEFWLRS